MNRPVVGFGGSPGTDPKATRPEEAGSWVCGALEM